MNNLIEYIYNPHSAQANYNLAYEYELQNQFAPAISFYLRAAELDNNDIAYDSLLHLAICFSKLGGRDYSEKGWILHALALKPNRPEAYLLLSLYYERHKEWQESYTSACQGLNCLSKDNNLSFFIDFKPYKLIFQKAVSSWWIGRTKESRQLFFSMPELPLDEYYRQLVQNNISSLGSGRDPFIMYDPLQHDNLRLKFKDSKNIKKNYSQVMQDIFVLMMTNGKREGVYLEIGAADPIKGSNTYLLEKEFNWKGISIESDEKEVAKWKGIRSNQILCRDATTINFDNLLKEYPETIDYLQLDCEPPSTTYQILTQIPFETHKFSVITFEHDYYADAWRKYRELSRNFLNTRGYCLIAGNISPDDKSPFEDWWIHKDILRDSLLSITEEDKDILNIKDFIYLK